jgi:1-acyl-sn-glycerol-3-phosphate acyltransferase
MVLLCSLATFAVTGERAMDRVLLNEKLYDLWKKRSEWWVRTQRVCVSGLQHIPRQGAAVLAANHINWKDIFFIGGVVPRRVSFVGTAELFDLEVCREMVERYIREHFSFAWAKGTIRRVSDWAARVMVTRVPYCGTIPVKRGVNDKSFFALAKEALRQGSLLCIFPEGGTSRPERLRRFKYGLAKIVYDLHHEGLEDIPILPTALRGTEHPYFPGRKLTFRVGAPHYIRDYIASHEKQTLRLFSERLRDSVQELLERGKQYARRIGLSDESVAGDSTGGELPLCAT